METTPRANRPHIAVFGKRNVGKSSLINALTNQELALVSEVAGTTTDPVYKSMELLPLGPVVMIDTAGIDDTGSLGELRVQKTMEVIRKTDLAILVVDPLYGIDNYEKNLINKLRENQTEVIAVLNKTDKILESDAIEESNIQERSNFKARSSTKDYLVKLIDKIEAEIGLRPLSISALRKKGIEQLRTLIASKAPQEREEPFIIGDLIAPGEVVILVTPIDLAAPKGRLILPQVQTIRDVLDNDGIAIVTKERELRMTLRGLNRKPKIVVTDSQAFMKVDADVPEDILLTSFSILFARYKGDLEIFIDGALKLEELKPGDKILIAEACTHRRQADDIGTVKIPRWLRLKVGGDLQFEHVSGREYPANLEEYDLILHCGGCMLNRKEVISRLQEARQAGVPVVNYGMAIAQLHGILDRALKPFPEIRDIWLHKRETSGLKEIL